MGSFLYMPPAGTVLAPGSNQILSTTFTPADTADYATVSATVTINVSGIITTVPAIITTVAGTPQVYGYGGDGGPATAATLNFPGHVAVDASGDLFMSDANNNRDSRSQPLHGVITTVAGNGSYGYSGDGGPATAANLAGPAGVAVDAPGTSSSPTKTTFAFREVNHATGVITTVAGDGSLRLRRRRWPGHRRHADEPQRPRSGRRRQSLYQPITTATGSARSISPPG